MRGAARWAAVATCRRRHRLPPPPPTDALYSPAQDVLPSPDRLLTDRGSYIAYLEVRTFLLPAPLPHARRHSTALQPTRRTNGPTLDSCQSSALLSLSSQSQLERVSAACLTVTSFDERLEQAVSAIRCLEEKTLNLARLVAVTQQFAEQQEVAQRESAAEIQRRLRSVEARLEELEEPARAAAWEAKLRAGELGQVDGQTAGHVCIGCTRTNHIGTRSTAGSRDSLRACGRCACRAPTLPQRSGMLTALPLKLGSHSVLHCRPPLLLPHRSVCTSRCQACGNGGHLRGGAGGGCGPPAGLAGGGVPRCPPGA